MDDGLTYLCTEIVLIDDQKAFDTVEYSILAKKLSDTDAHGHKISWIKSHRSGRKNRNENGVNCWVIDLFRQRSPYVGIVRNQGIGSVLWTSSLLMLGNAEVLRKDRILPFAFVSIDV